jgi:hypothetical protein
MGSKKQAESIVITLCLLGAAKYLMHYLEFLGFFLSLVALGLSGFCPIHPQPQLPFFSAIFITSFL